MDFILQHAMTALQDQVIDGAQKCRQGFAATGGRRDQDTFFCRDCWPGSGLYGSGSVKGIFKPRTYSRMKLRGQTAG